VDIRDVLRVVEEEERFRLSPLNLAVALAMPVTLNIHDAIICGTALVYRDLLGEDVKVITKDRQIADSQLVETVW
jgi:hypothetical protein